MSVPALATEPASLVAVDQQCAAIETWAEECGSVPELQDATHKLAAIDEYLLRTSSEGRGRVAAAMRRLEVRIGHLVGPPQTGRRTDLEPVERDRQVGWDLPKDRRSQFRQMAQHADVVEEEIARSTDDNPVTHRGVMRAVRAAKAGEAPPPKPKEQSDMDEYLKLFRTLKLMNAALDDIDVKAAIRGSRTHRLAKEAVKRTDRVVTKLIKFRDGVEGQMEKWQRL